MESRQAADRDRAVCPTLPHPIPLDKPYDELPFWQFEQDFAGQLQASWGAYVRWSWRLLKDVYAHRPQLELQEQTEQSQAAIGQHLGHRPRSRAWSLLPHKSLTRSAILVDSEALADLVGTSSVSTGDRELLLKQLRANDFRAWNRYFKVKQFGDEKGELRRFEGSIRTDGVSCSVLMERPGVTAGAYQAAHRRQHVGSEQRHYLPVATYEGVRLVAIDPGEKSPLNGVVDGDEQRRHDVIGMSGKEYRMKAGFPRFTGRRKARLVGSPEMARLLRGIPNYHVSESQMLHQHIRYVLEHALALRAFAGSDVVAKDK